MKFVIALFLGGNSLIGMINGYSNEQQDVTSVVAKAIEAQGGLKHLRIFRQFYVTTKGKMCIGAKSIDVKSKHWFKFPCRMRSVITIDLLGGKKSVKVKTLDEKYGWLKWNGDLRKLTDREIEEAKQVVFEAFLK